MVRLLINVAGVYAGWFGCVLAAANGRPLLGLVVVAVVVAVHLALHPARAREAGLIAVITLAGTAVDTSLLASGLLHFGDSNTVSATSVLWFAALWANFATTLSLCLRWLWTRLPLAAVLGVAAGPLTYYGGAEMGAIGLHAEVWPSLVAWGIEWGLGMPVMASLASRWHRAIPIARPA